MIIRSFGNIFKLFAEDLLINYLNFTFLKKQRYFVIFGSLNVAPIYLIIINFS